MSLITIGDNTVDARQLEVFVAVARLRSFTKAAAELHLVQSAVSATVAALEADLGERLFDRSTRRVVPTAAGRALLPHATEILVALRMARDAVESVSGGMSGSLRIGYMTNVTLFDIPALLGRFSQAYPHVSMRLSPADRGTAGLADALRAGDIDVAFLSAAPGDFPDLEIAVLAASPLALAVPAGHPLGRRRRIRLAEMIELRFVDFRPGFANRTQVDRAFQERGLHRDVQIETSDTNDTAALVRNGLGVAFLPEYLVENDPAVHLVSVQDANMMLRVSVAVSRERRPSTAAARLVQLALAAHDGASPIPDEIARRKVGETREGSTKR
jgi:DNA-binding transcriptional LysR family regulator